MSIVFKESVLYKDGIRISNSNNLGVLKLLSSTFFINDSKYIFKPMRDLIVQIDRDFKNAAFDDIKLMSLVGLGDYIGLIVPNKDRIIIQLEYKMLDKNKVQDKNKRVFIKKYKAILIEKEISSAINTLQTMDSAQRQAWNQREAVEVSFQLIQESTLNLLQSDIANITRKCTVQDLIVSSMNMTLTKDKNYHVFDPDKITKIDIEPPDNKKVYEQLHIEMGTKTLDIPNYVQHMYGVYNHGLGSYVYDSTWWVYKLYDNNWIQALPGKTINFIVVPQGLFSGYENTYEVLPDTINIVVAGTVEFFTQRSSQALNNSTGVRWSDPANLSDRPQTSDNKVKLDRSKSMSEYNLVDIGDKSKNISTPSKINGSNIYKMNSDITKDTGAVMSFAWSRADSSLIKPNMRCTISYLGHAGVVIKRKAKILGAVFVQRKLGIYTENVMETDATVTLYVDHNYNSPSASVYKDKEFSNKV